MGTLRENIIWRIQQGFTCIQLSSHWPLKAKWPITQRASCRTSRYRPISELESTELIWFAVDTYLNNVSIPVYGYHDEKLNTNTALVSPLSSRLIFRTLLRDLASRISRFWTKLLVCTGCSIKNSQQKKIWNAVTQHVFFWYCCCRVILLHGT